MNILAIDTSTSLASIAVAVDDQIVAESLLNTNRTLSARIVPEIERILATAGLTIADIDLFASSIGPGSFTGVRGGVATIQGLALAFAKPCVGFSSLSLLAMNFSHATTRVCPMIDARKSELYAALFDCSSSLPSPLISDCVLPPAALLDQISATTEGAVIFVGDGAVRYHDQIAERMGNRAIFASFPLNNTHAANGIILAQHASKEGRLLEPGQLLPVYLRASDAEINHTSKKLP
ncbi:MAG: tRNA (adenosine(37)-N6)-threonylcarbamoyltransferase complex dimerization subunit type 1 TsaB [Desulfuromonadaceae bacterium]|nr:tRNA (adenosine(37)-N6)-threonylcarbamoyltransferase complex dimerization subunit type 1 TsaB [Desulfuromonadaceae bacterium]MDD2848767.1 tRNA (adenosine(37)-N6)-threonylcarbamoyltransferase complex dimerization subunit type 1 TsaB [Desulfuromonadaceae bacterium]MDD4130417.1 tRNA (adenosine(37)-N6)-threonylcarbamoyltransferase complex dimerization subunit type 1 TsaB [Desulfuromonadaceae bacterium]